MNAKYMGEDLKAYQAESDHTVNHFEKNILNYLRNLKKSR